MIVELRTLCGCTKVVEISEWVPEIEVPYRVLMHDAVIPDASLVEIDDTGLTMKPNSERARVFRFHGPMRGTNGEMVYIEDAEIKPPGPPLDFSELTLEQVKLVLAEIEKLDKAV